MAGVKLIVAAFRLNELIMRTALDDAAVFHDHDTVRILNGAEAMGNDEGRAAFHKGIHAVLHELFGSCIN